MNVLLANLDSLLRRRVRIVPRAVEHVGTVLHAEHVALDTLVLAAVATVAVVVEDRAWRKGKEGRREGG
jgi:hypothetical protein